MRKLCVYTVVSGDYVHYIPMFLYWMGKSYPEYDVVIDVLGPYWYTQTRAKHHFVKNWLSAQTMSGVTGATTAALRFVGLTPLPYEYVLITDIDIMHMRETPGILEQHLKTIDGKCYDNYYSNGGDRCPGVHFVTKDWWKATESARLTYKDHLLNTGSPAKDYDEKMLLDIIKQSSLPEPSKKMAFWTHGVHLGTYRDCRRTPQVDAFQSRWIATMLDDASFMDIVREQSKHMLDIGKTFAMLKRIREGR